MSILIFKLANLKLFQFGVSVYFLFVLVKISKSPDIF